MNKFIVLHYERFQTMSKDKSVEAKKQYDQKEKHKPELVQNKEAIPKEKNLQDVQFVDQMGLGDMTPPPPAPPRYIMKTSAKRLKTRRTKQLTGHKRAMF
eukprot:GHVU01080081.1.p1 GENE.GHVU01080081.1~~GHVU01080081.1.p1  ORF type:complete len:100 (-),score=18.10 GHVU01080081.1:82-381(-)